MFWPKKVNKTTEELDTEKANGADSIQARVLNISCSRAGQTVGQIIPALIFEYYFLQQKERDKHDPNNYRPVSLLSIISRKKERLLNPTTYKYVCRQRLISDTQCGFRAGHSTCDVVTYIVQQLHNALKLHGTTAFSTVDNFEYDKYGKLTER